MLKISTDTEIQILEILHPKLLIEKNEPIKFHLDGFMPFELLRLRDIVKKNGGQISSDPGPGVITLSPSNYFPMTGGERFNIDWLHESISLNAVQNILKYELKPGSVVTIKDDPDVQEKNEMPVVDKSAREPQIRQIASSPKKSVIATKSAARPEIQSYTPAICHQRNNDGFDNDEVSLCERRGRKTREVSCKKQICACCGSCRTKKRPAPSRSTFYSPKEERAMINFLIANEAIHKGAGGFLIWEKMVREKRSNRKPSTLQSYFNNHLRYRVHLHTNDPQVLAEFKKREIKLKKRRHRLD